MVPERAEMQEDVETEQQGTYLRSAHAARIQTDSHDASGTRIFIDNGFLVKIPASVLSYPPASSSVAPRSESNWMAC